MDPFSEPLRREESPSQEVINEGRIKLLAASFGVLCVSIFTIVHFIVTIGPNRLPAQIIRFSLTCWLGYSVYRGSRVAKTIAVILSCLGAFGFLALLLTFRVDWLNAVAFIANSISYASYVIVLLFSDEVDEFLQLQRKRREKPRRPTHEVVVRRNVE